MRCPKCGSKIPRGSSVCFKCGTKLSQIREASFKAVAEAKANYEYDKIVLSTNFPKDLNYKTTLLLCIFGGTFGLHMFYVKRIIPAIIYLFGWLYFLTFLLIAGYTTGFDINAPIIFEDNKLKFFFILACITGAFVVFCWLCDIFRIARKKFKVPVVLKEK